MVEAVNLAGAHVSEIMQLALKFDVANRHHPAVNTAAVVTLTADAAGPIYLGQIDLAYDLSPVGGSVKVEDGSGTTVWGPFPITSTGLTSKTFCPPLYGSKNTALIVTLAAAGSGVTGAIAVNAWKLQ